MHSRETAVAKLELPGDRIGDLFVLSARDWVIGRTPEHHDLAKLEGTLRSHGGRYEEMVPSLSPSRSTEVRRLGQGRSAQL
ncbi:MAG: hypothetical protein Ct9H300mP32_2180 [Verrucomicrobiota bacterium]|nr:MAG: hypothetical protein Ct9H300mP32_2180 [Verrucomicrobiota bacterium]